MEKPQEFPLLETVAFDSPFRPIEKIGQVKGPVLIIAGSDDRHTLLEESNRMYARASKPKEIWVIEGAQHINFHKFAAGEDERRILGFFDQFLIRRR